MLNKELSTGESPGERTVHSTVRSSDIDLSLPLEDIIRNIVMEVLEECGGNQRAAARRLQISRTTLWRMLKDN